jgi:hypothetical protein
MNMRVGWIHFKPFFVNERLESPLSKFVHSNKVSKFNLKLSKR